ncbi:MAG: metal-dependent hydrolase [Bacteroidetes bacterium GWE2_29_8]|nr:MAG: metal-dependent hydrolase [Bacteroidetes bacterium GWE2_29_8]OFY18062.1 MAG: metal-dependent hydrolase [Bacteroidetes bacterium GWF2_29_10]
MSKIDIGNIAVEVTKKDIKNIHLTVYPPNGIVRLSAPKQINDETIRLYIISKIPWIRKQQRKYKKQDRQSQREYKQRESHYFLGKRYLIRIFEHNATPQIIIKNKTYIDLCIRPGTTVEQRHIIMNEWYRKKLKEMIPELINKWQKIIGVEVNDWGVKLMKTKWGTCNIQSKRIWINLELAKKPLYCIEYIIVHELIHLKERLHNENYFAYINKFMPQWKLYQEELNNLPISHTEWENKAQGR